MLLWALYPTATCSWQAFRDMPAVGEESNTQLDAWRADRERVDQAQGFAGRMWASCETCYQKTPIFSDDTPWRGNIIVSLFVVAVVSRFAHAYYLRRHRTALY